MTTELVQQLFNKYLDGNTTPQEEQELLNFFTSQQVPDSLKTEQAYFLSIFNEKQAQQLEDSLSRKIEAWDAAEQAFRLATHHSRKRRWLWAAGIAASVALILTVGIRLLNKPVVDLNADTFDSPELAYATTEQSLALLSRTINKGCEELEKISEITQSINNKSNK